MISWKIIILAPQYLHFDTWCMNVGIYLSKKRRTTTYLFPTFVIKHYYAYGKEHKPVNLKAGVHSAVQKCEKKCFVIF